MAVRVYQLSKAFGVTNTEIVQVCRRCGIPVRSHSSSLTNEQGQRVLNYYKEKGKLPKEPIDLAPPPPKKESQKKPAKKPAKKKAPKKEIAAKEGVEKGPQSAETAAMEAEAAPAEEVVEAAAGATKKKPSAETTAAKAAAQEVSVAAAAAEAQAPAQEVSGKKAAAEQAVEQTPQAVEAPSAAPAEKTAVDETEKEKDKTKKEAAEAEKKGARRDEVKRIESNKVTVKPRSKPKVRIIERRELTPEQRTQIAARFSRPPAKGPRSPIVEQGGGVFVPPKFGERTRRKGKTRRDHELEQQVMGEAGLLKLRKPEEEQVFIKPEKIEVELPVTLKDLSSRLGIKANVLSKKLLEHGIITTINQILDGQTIDTLAIEFETEILIRKAESKEDQLLAESKVADAPETLVVRPPVVTFLGHVDHGKTSLLDAIRKTRVAAGEVGGITQKLGAYSVQSEKGPVVFLDTPGHEAFTQMRSRGAQITDVAVLVVAADDGVMPQTIEALNHAKDAKVPIVVAINKCDLPSANPLRVKQQLTVYGLNPEEWGGETVMVEVSAVTTKGLSQLVEMLGLEAELLELKANPDKQAMGTVLEASMSPGRGVVATFLVQDGTLKIGDIVLAGSAFGRVKAMMDDRGLTIDVAGPSTPIQVTGLSSVPEAGDKFQAVDDLSRARSVAIARERRSRLASLAKQREHVTLDTLFDRLQESQVKEVRVVLKADSKGSAEALEQMLAKLGTQEVTVRVVHSGVGAITESDVLLADASDAVVIGFTVHPDERTRQLAHERGVEIRLYQIIYQVSEDLNKALEGMLETEKTEEVTGHAEVRKIFKISRVGTISGCMVTDGVIERANRLRLIRDGVVVLANAPMDGLRREKDDVRDVRAGFECGIKVHGFDDTKPGDVIETFKIVERRRTLATK